MIDTIAAFAKDLGPGSFMLAYLDAGTGSIIFQWVVAGLLGAAFAIRMSWRRITAMLSRKSEADDSDVAS